MRKALIKFIFPIILLMFALIVSVYQTHAFWDNNQQIKSNIILLGNWESPIEQLTDGYIIDIWIEEDNLNQTIPENQLFSYNGLLYVVRDGEEYNPQWHGLPGNGGNQWAYVSIELEWRPNVNYRVNSVVIRDGRWFIANPNYNSADWFVNDPLSKSGTQWSEWREIEPLEESYFDYLIEYPALKDYRADIGDVIFV